VVLIYNIIQGFHVMTLTAIPANLETSTLDSFSTFSISLSLSRHSLNFSLAGGYSPTAQIS
jgi:hypothetical protein